MPIEPDLIAENHHLRSSYMQVLLRRRAATETTQGPTSIPKVIIQFWHDVSSLPADVRECMDSWDSLLSSGFARVLFDDVKARRFITEQYGTGHVRAFDRCAHPAMRCDYFRLCYLLRRGGFYVDADDVYQGGEWHYLYDDDRLKLQPLCYDTGTDSMIAPNIFRREEASSPEWVYYANNNPIIAPPEHPVIRLALRRATGLLLSSADARRDIQSTTGPGNLTASLVKHSLSRRHADEPEDFLLIADWESIAVSRWPLSYRDDERNWRLWGRIRERA